ncbi:hypothetical protein WOLCODRAFT_140964, partial [Wolfiporia cocos MD-104 SS10]
ETRRHITCLQTDAVAAAVLRSSGDVFASLSQTSRSKRCTEDASVHATLRIGLRHTRTRPSRHHCCKYVEPRATRTHPAVSSCATAHSQRPLSNARSNCDLTVVALTKFPRVASPVVRFCG